MLHKKIWRFAIAAIIMLLSTTDLHLKASGLNGTWEKLASVNTKRAAPSTAEYDGKLYVFGGQPSWNASKAWADTKTKTSEVYDPERNTWTYLADMPQALSNAHAVVVNDRIYLLGGLNSTWNSVKTVYIYTPKTNTWSQGTDLPVTFHSLDNATTLNGKIYIFGVQRSVNKVGTFTKAAYEYSTNNNTWRKLADTPIAPASGKEMGAFTYKNEIYISSMVDSSIYKYNVSSNSYTFVRKFTTLPIKGVANDTLYTLVKKENECAIYEYNMENGVETYLDTVPYGGGRRLVFQDRIMFVSQFSSNTDMASRKMSDAVYVYTSTKSNSEDAMLQYVLKVKENAQLSITNDVKDNSKYTWSSSNPDVATVDSNGKVIAASIGNTEIIATDSNIPIYKANILVVAETSIKIIPNSITISIGEKSPVLEYKITPDDLSYEQILWNTDSNDIATISNRGIVTGKNIGNAIVKLTIVTDSGKKYSAFCEVTVIP